MSKAITKTKRNVDQDIFCYEWVKDRNGARAAIAAGYSEKTAASQASRLLKNVNIQKKIRQILDKGFASEEVTIGDIIRHFIKLTNYDITEIYDDQGRLKHPKDWPEDLKHVIQGVETVETTNGTGKEKEYYYTHKIKMPDRFRPAEALARYLKMFLGENDTKHEIKVIWMKASDYFGNNGRGGKAIKGEDE